MPEAKRFRSRRELSQVHPDAAAIDIGARMHVVAVAAGLKATGKNKGVWTYFYRAVDSLGQTIDFLLSARRDASAAQRFFCEALRQPHPVNPRTITVDKNPAYPGAVRDLKRAGQLWRFSRLRQRKYLNNIVEQDHCRIKRLVRPGLDFGSLRTARKTLAGYAAMAMVREGQVHNVSGRDMKAQAAFVTDVFRVTA